MKLPSLWIKAGLVLLGLAGSSRPAHAQSSVSGFVFAAASSYTDDPFHHIPPSENTTIYSSGLWSANAADPSFTGADARAMTTVDVGPGHIGINATAATSIDPSLRAGSTSARNNAQVRYLDTIWFYSTSILYATLIDVHLQARVDGLMMGDSQGSSLPEYASFAANGRFSLSINGNASGSDDYAVRYSFDGTGISKLETGDVLLDLYLRVPNTPNMHYDLRLTADMDGQAVAYNGGVGGDTLAADYAFLFGSGLSWAGLVSATANGEPLNDPTLISSQYGVDYNRSYVVTAPPLSSVPEPSAYGAMAALLVGCLALRRAQR